MVQFQRALFQPLSRRARHVALLNKSAVAEVTVVSREREVAERMQPCLLNALPIVAESFAPLLRKVLILRQDVFDAVFAHIHALFATIIFQAAQPVAATAEVVEISGVQIAVKILVAGEAMVRRQHQKLRLHALEIAIFLQPLGKGREGLVHRVGRDCAHCATEDIRLEQPHALEQFRL